MEFSIVDCMFVFHDMEHLNKELKLKFNISCEINNDEPVQNIEVQNIEVPEINIKIKKEIIKKEVKPEIKKEEIIEEVKEEVKKGPKTPAQRQRERRERLKQQLGEEEFKKQNQKKMKEYRAKQQKEKNEEEEEDENIDDDNVSTTSSNNNNKLRNEDNMITCECGMCYHKSYKSRHLNSKTHIKGLEDKKEQEEQIQIDDKNDKLKIHKNYLKPIKDIDGKTIMLHPKINDCYDEITRYINMFVDGRINERQLTKNVHISIRDFMDENNIKYQDNYFKEYEYESDSDDSSDESE